MTSTSTGPSKRRAAAGAEADAAQPGTADRPGWLWKSAQALVRIWTTVAFDLKVYGVRNVPRTGGVLVVTNHQSLLDPFLLGVQHGRGMSYMAKSELFRNKAFAALIRSLGAFPVKQGSGDIGAIKETVSRLQEGRMLNIFPEGSRTETGEIGPMLPGAALVIRRMGPTVKVVPAAIDGSYVAWPKGRRYWRNRPVRVVYGPALDMTGLKGEQINAKIDKAVRTLFERLRNGQINNSMAADPLD
jgi:1-acyl-sn-glycerol-3-phosphate acyltransferase